MNTVDQPAANTTCVALSLPKDAVLITGPSGAVVLVTVQPDRTLRVMTRTAGELPPPTPPEAAAGWLARTLAAVRRKAGA